MTSADSTVDTHSSASGGAFEPRALVLRWLFPPGLPAPEVLRHGVTLGRQEGVTVRLDDSGVSRVHARVTREGANLVLLDEQSRNGTFVDGERVASAALTAGKLVRLGGCLGLVGVERDGELEFGELGPDLHGGSVLRAALAPAERAAKSDLPLIVIAETGSGKERLARAVHAWSGRPGPFQAVNCAALPDALAEALLFGHRKGAFTGANEAAMGHFRQAHRGTLLLDEVSDLSLETQARLLRVLQEREVTPVGESAPIPVDVRIVCCTQQPLGQAVLAKRFREDLYMRLRGLELTLPPLRERIEDVPALFQLFLGRYWLNSAPPTMSASLLERLCLHRWPGNVRELEWLARRLATLSGPETLLTRRHLPLELRGTEPSGAPQEAAAHRRHIETLRLAKGLRQHEGNVSAACASINLSRQRAYRLLAGRTVEQFLRELDDESPAPGAP